MEDVLQGKTLVALGDSLIFGNRLGNEATWVNLLGKKHGMTVVNAGINGNPIAKPRCPIPFPPMCERYRELPDGADYVVVLGGANDKNLNVPIGADSDEVPDTFKGALNLLIRGLCEKYPKAKMLFMTNYNRWGTNAEGRTDLEFVIAMEEICRKWAVPCFNNYYESGISFQNPAQIPWIDEGRVLDGTGENHHFSAEAYEWLLPKYEALIMAL